MRALKNLLDKLSSINERHGEITDTHVREQMGAAVFHGFIAQTKGFVVQSSFGMEESAGNRAVKKALEAFIGAAVPEAKKLGLKTPQARFSAFQDGSILSANGESYDEFFGSAKSYKAHVASVAWYKPEAEKKVPRVRRKKHPLWVFPPGSVGAVAIDDERFCYIRSYLNSTGVLPFLSKGGVLAPGSLPTLQAEIHFDFSSGYYDAPPKTVLVGSFPFKNEKESLGEPSFEPPDEIVTYYLIHDATRGDLWRDRKTFDKSEVAGMRQLVWHKPSKVAAFLAGKTNNWPVIDLTGSQGGPAKPPTKRAASPRRRKP